MNTIVHDLIKIKYVEEGYLPNWPYHLISEEEMCDAFMRLEQDTDINGLPTGPHYYRGYFFHKYPLIHGCLNSTHSAYQHNESCTGCYKCDICGNCVADIDCGCCDACKYTNRCGIYDEAVYSNLVKAMHYHIKQFLNPRNDINSLPDWVYGYMLGTVITYDSSIEDIHDMILPMGADNPDDIFGPEQTNACYKWSKMWLYKYADPHTASFAPLTMNSSHVAYDIHELYLSDKIGEDANPSISYFADADTDKDGNEIFIPKEIYTRPPTMFGEPHVLKAVRVDELHPSIVR